MWQQMEKAKRKKQTQDTLYPINMKRSTTFKVNGRQMILWAMCMVNIPMNSTDWQDLIIWPMFWMQCNEQCTVHTQRPNKQHHWTHANYTIAMHIWSSSGKLHLFGLFLKFHADLFILAIKTRSMCRKKARQTIQLAFWLLKIQEKKHHQQLIGSHLFGVWHEVWHCGCCYCFVMCSIPSLADVCMCVCLGPRTFLFQLICGAFNLRSLK